MRFEWQTKAEWGDCDPAGIIFYPNFYRWFDAGSQSLMDHHGFGQEVMIRKFGIKGFPLIETHAEFLTPVFWNDQVTVVSEVKKWTRKTFRVNHTILVGARQCVNGYEIRFWGKVDPVQENRLIVMPMPDEFVTYLNGFENKN